MTFPEGIPRGLWSGFVAVFDYDADVLEDVAAGGDANYGAYIEPYEFLLLHQNVSAICYNSQQ